jgi:hypothetical protein
MTTLSRQHFKALAEEIAKIQEHEARKEAAFAVARACVKFNPGFNPATFYKACGIMAS